MVAALETKQSKQKCITRSLMLLISAAAAMGAQSRQAYAQFDEGCKSELIKVRMDSTPADTAGNRASLRLCVRRVDSASRATRLRHAQPQALQLATMFFDVPEYHDEGRLPIDREMAGGELGPVAGIYASPFLGGFTRPAQIYEQGLPGTFAALVIVEGKPGDPVPQSYARLQLQTGVNCVYLYVDPPTAGSSGGYLANLRYTARVSHPTDGRCDRNAAMTASVLPVIAVKSNRFSGDTDYPAVARFDTDINGHPLMSVRCLNAFCEIGVATEKGVRAPDHLNRPNSNAAKWDPLVGGERQKIVKGWHDEQALAIRGTDYVWRASDVKALILPEPDAAQYDSANFHNQWKTVGTIQIDKAVPTTSKYYRWGLRQGDNKLQFRYNPANTKWEAQVISPSGAAPIPWGLMERTVHHDVTVPAIVRFRWTEADDGVWAPCGNACCKASYDQ
jgi:hypothetical protein